MTRTCLACGNEGDDVAMRLVETPPSDRRTVTVAVAVAESRRGPAGLEYRDVPERYANEPRCRDVKACAERVATIELGEAPPPTTDDDALPWPAA